MYCIDVGVYEMHLTLNKSYEVVERNKEKNQTRIKGDSGRLVWIPDYYLNDTLSPEFDLWLESDFWEQDENWDSENDFMIIGVTLPDGRCFSLNVWTYSFFNSQVKKVEKREGLENKYIKPPDLFVKALSRDVISEVISDILRHDDNLDETLYDPVFSLKYPEPWVDADELPDLGESLENELRKELGDGHVLFGKEINAIAKRQDNDDVLFSFDKGKLALVHLTWRETKEIDDYPKTQLFYNMKHFWEENLKNGIHETSGNKS